MVDDTDVLTLEETARLLKMLPSAIYRLTARKKIPHYVIGRRLRFSRAAVEAWLSAQDVPMADLIPAGAPRSQNGVEVAPESAPETRFRASRSTFQEQSRGNTHSGSMNGKTLSS
jgi:excisionase family DNA binding protein